jgi:hypothetical protein
LLPCEKQKSGSPNKNNPQIFLLHFLKANRLLLPM